MKFPFINKKESESYRKMGMGEGFTHGFLGSGQLQKLTKPFRVLLNKFISTLHVWRDYLFSKANVCMVFALRPKAVVIFPQKKLIVTYDSQTLCPIGSN